ncbi:MAG: RHS repeat-associated core domain-containing protein [Terracidiphilus sp.]
MRTRSFGDATLNRLRASTPIPGMTTITGYLYDASGTRVSKGSITAWSCDPGISGFTATNDYILGPGGEQMTEMGIGSASSANPSNASNSALTWQHTNVYAAGSLIATYDNDGLHFYFNDPLGTRRAQTDYAGVLEQTCSSLPFGDALACSGGNLQAPTEHHFTGKERDIESGLDYFEARYYSSAMGRFMSPDWSAKAEPVPYAKLGNPQSLNLYAYMMNNPLGGVDFDGHQCESGKDGCIEPRPVQYMPGGSKTAVTQVMNTMDDLTKPLQPLQPIAKQIVEHDVQANFSVSLAFVTKSTDGSTSYTPTLAGVSIDGSGKFNNTFNNNSGEELGELDFGTSHHTSISVSASQNSNGDTRPSGAAIHVGVAFPDLPVTPSVTNAGVRAIWNFAVSMYQKYVDFALSNF